MQKLVCSIAFLGLMAGSTGCIISSDDDDGGGGGGGDGILLNLSWICPVDATGLLVQAVPVGSTTSIDDNIDCAEAQPAAILYDAGDYDLYVTPTAPGLSFVTDFDTFGGVDGDSVSLDFSSFPDDAGYFTLTWTINGEDPAIECANVAADGVSVLATLIGTSTALEDLFDCEVGGGTTDELPIGDYEVDVSALDGEQAISEPDTFTTSIDYGSELNDLGNIDLTVL